MEHRSHPRITSVEMGIVSPHLILRESVCEVFESSLYVRQLPKPNGVNDLRMGTSDWHMKCSTCNNDVINCPGHIGHINLAKPMYNPGVVQTIVKVLKCVCFFCSALIVPPDDPRLQTERFLHSEGKARLIRIMDLSKNKHQCPHCGGPQPKYTSSGAVVKHEFEEKYFVACESTDEEREWAVEPLNAEKVMSMLRHISDDDCVMMGMNPEKARPEWMVLTVMVVPPPIIRPSIRFSDNSRSRGQDDLTTILQDIVKANNSLKKARADDNPKLAKKAEDDLQDLLATYFHKDSKKGAVGGAANSASGPPHSNRALRTVPTRLKGKKGRMRGNLSGKRVDNCARSVVSPNPTGDIDELCVPQAMACKLTIPERVTDFNMDDLYERVLKGPGVLGGASNIVEPDGTVRDLRLAQNRSSIRLEVGTVVNRHLKNGDTVMFNRQPSLHKMSIMSFRIRITQDYSFRVPLSTVTCFNADFDGDEMNMHVSQTLDARAEQQVLMLTTQQIISAQANKPIISLVQDSLISAYLMTLKQQFFTKAEVMQLTMVLRYPKFNKLPRPAILYPVELWTGKQVFSLLLPRVNLDKVVRDGQDLPQSPEAFMDIEERRVLIREGELLAGSLCKKTLGNAAGGVVHVIVNDVGYQEAANFIGDAQRLLVMFMESCGFSVGIADCVAPDQTVEDVKSLLDRCMDRCRQIGERAQYAPEQVVEGTVTSLLQGMITKGSSTVQEHMRWDNNINLLVTCGAKGSPVNITQIMAFVGQQSVKGGRVKGHPLPSFDGENPTPQSKGFVTHSYAQGLTPEEYFYHAMGGREGLVDTAVKTAETGYIQRRLMKCLEHWHVANDGTVRDVRGNLFCTFYGGDGVDATKIEKQGLRTAKMSDAQIEAVFGLVECGWSREEVEEYNRWQLPVIRGDRDRFRNLKLGIALELDTTVFVPLHVPRIIKMVKYANHGGEVMSYQSFREKREALIAEFVRLKSEDATFYLQIYLRATLDARTLWESVGMHEAAVDAVFREVRRRVHRSTVDPGEMVGTLAASSIGEPCTQMTLNTFHLSGVANKNMTQGVPRLKELIGAANGLKTPSLSIRLEKGYRDSEHMARRLANSITYLKLGDVVHDGDIVFDPDPNCSQITEDNEWVQVWAELCDFGEGLSPWVIRLVLDRQFTENHGLTVVDVAEAVENYMGESAQVLRSETNTVDWVIRIRVRNLEVEGVELGDKFEELAIKTVFDYLLDNTPVNGIKGIKRAFNTQERSSRVGDGGVLTSEGEWIIDTDGTNMRRIMGLEGVDPYRTISNDIQEVISVLGIAAGMAVMMDELRQVLSFDGGYVDDRHIQMLAQFMTQNGKLKAVSRHGLKDLGGSTFQRASYEECSEVLNTAAIFGTKEEVKGVTESVIMGQQMPTGTGICGVLTEKGALPPEREVRPVEPMLPVVAQGFNAVKPLDVGKLKVTPTQLVDDAILPPGLMDSSDDEDEVEVSPAKRFRPSSPEYVEPIEWRPSSPVYL